MTYNIWPAPITISDTVICSSDTIEIGKPPKPGYTYSWSPAGSVSDPTIANPQVFPDTPTTYTLIANGPNCPDTATVRVELLSDSVYISSTTGSFGYCPGQGMYLQAHGSGVFQWYLNGDSTGTSGRQKVVVSDTGLYEAVIARCDNGQPDTLSAYVYWAPANFNYTPDTTYLCPGPIVATPLHATGGTVLHWLKEGTIISDSTRAYLVADDTGTYSAIQYDSCGYLDTGYFEVIAQPAVPYPFNMADSTVLCQGHDTLLYLNGDTVYSWHLNGNELSSHPGDTLLVDTTGNIEAIFENLHGCRDTNSLYIKQLENQDLYAEIAINNVIGDTHQTCYLSPALTAIDSPYINRYHWNFGTGNPNDTSNNKTTNFIFPDTGTYQVTMEGWNEYCPTDKVNDTTIIIIHEKIKADYKAGPPTCFGTPVPFTNQTTWSTNEPINWKWRFTTTDTSELENPTKTYNNPGTYFAILEANSPFPGCSDTISKIFTISGPPTVSTPATTFRCTNDSTSLTVTAQNYNNLPDSNLSYDWTPKTTINCDTCQNPKVWPTQNTQYTVTVTNEYGCISTDQTLVIPIDPPTVEAGNDQQICQGGSVTLNATPFPAGTYSYEWSPPNALSNASAKQTEAFPGDTTTYTITITHFQTGCQAKDSVTVYPSNITANAKASDRNICTGDTTELQANNLINATYHWNPGNTISDSTAKKPKAWPDTHTVYTLTITDTTSGCASKDTVMIKTGTPPQITITGPTVACQGGTINLTAAGAKHYQWQPNNLINCDTCKTITTTPAQTTTYTVTGTDEYGCENTASHTISIIQKPDLQTSPDTTICPGTETQLNVTGGDTINWSPNSTLSCDTCRNPIATPWTNTTYTVTTSVAGGCKDTANVTVDVLPAPSDPISGFYYDICLGDTLQLNASGGKTYDWTPKQNITGDQTNNPQVWPENNTTYTLTITYGQENCPWQDSVKVRVDKGQGTLPNDTTICAGQSATLKAEGYQSYQWQSTGNLPCTNCNEITVSPSTTTTYTLTATSATGCDVEKEITITIESSPTITINGPDSLCANTKDTLTATGAQNYQWYPTSGIVQSTGEIEPTQTTTFTVEATSQNGCFTQATHTVNVKPLPNVNATQDTLICLGQSTPLQASGAQSYQWSPDTTIDCQSCPSIIATPTTDLTYTVTGTANNGCTNTDTVRVDVSPNPIVTAPSDTTICKGDTIQIRALDNNQHEWKPQNQVDCPTCDTVTISPQTKTVFTVTAYGPESCTASDTVVVDVQKPQVTASNDTTVCPNDNFTLAASGGQTYEWQPTGQTTATIETSTAKSQNYTVTGYDNLGCTDTANIQITVHDTIDPHIAGDTIVCPGEKITWTVTEGQMAYWLELDTNAMVLSFSTFQPFHFSTFITDQHGCTYTRTKQLTLHPTPTLTTSPDQTIRQYEELQLEASGANTYAWNPDDWLSDTSIANPTFQSLQAGQFTYTVTGYNQFGCKDTARLNVTVEPKPEVAIPNAFSPNGDGNNDIFEVKLPEDYQLLELHIYDRWGNRVYASEGQPWDGFIDGEPAAMGTYVYVLKYEDGRGEVIEKQGNVTVVR